MIHSQWFLLLIAIMNFFWGICWSSKTAGNMIIKTIFFVLAGWGLLEFLASGIVTGIKIF